MKYRHFHFKALDYLSSHATTLKWLSRYGRLKRFLMTLILGNIIPIPISKIYCHILGIPGYVTPKYTPHYKSLVELSNENSAYGEYLKRYGTKVGYPAHVSFDKFMRLARNLKYLSTEYKNHHIIVVEIAEGYLVLDGTHRISILASRGNTNVIVKKVPLWWVVPFLGWEHYCFLQCQLRK